MTSIKKFQILLASALGLMFFQNCSQVGFSSTHGSSALVATTSTPTDNGGTPNIVEPPPPPPTTTVTPPPDGNGDTVLVECDLGGPSTKIALDTNPNSVEGQSSNG